MDVNEPERALEQKAELIRAEMRRSSSAEARARYRIGIIVNEVRGDARYGDRGVQALAVTLAVRPQFLYEASRLAAAFSETQIRELLPFRATPPNHGVALSHLLELSRVDDSDSRAKMLAQATAERWTARKTREVVDQLLQVKASPPARLSDPPSKLASRRLAPRPAESASSKHSPSSALFDALSEVEVLRELGVSSLDSLERLPASEDLLGRLASVAPHVRAAADRVAQLADWIEDLQASKARELEEQRYVENGDPELETMVVRGERGGAGLPN